MGYFRFHRSARIAPGVRLNVSRSGSSLSIGEPGATLNIGENHQSYTSNLPGTGLSYIERSTRSKRGTEGQTVQSVSRAIDEAVAAASALSDGDLKTKLKEAIFDSVPHKEDRSSSEDEAARLARWDVKIFRAELARRSGTKSTADVRTVVEEILGEAGIETAMTAEVSKPSASAMRVRGPSKLMVLFGGILAGWRIGKRI